MSIVRRVVERGLKRAQELENSEFIDIFQHILDELNVATLESCTWITFSFDPCTLEEYFRTSCRGTNFITRMPVDEMNYCHLCGMNIKRKKD